MGRVLTELTDHERATAMARFHLLQPFLEHRVALTDLARQHRRPLRTLRRWVQRYRTAGLAGLVRTPRHDRGTRRRLPPVLHQYVEGIWSGYA
jgi:putative transposase